MAQHVLDLRALQPRVDRHRDRAGVEAGEVADRQFGPVVHVQGDAVARVRAGCDQVPGETSSRYVQLGIVGVRQSLMIGIQIRTDLAQQIQAIFLAEPKIQDDQAVFHA